MLTGRNLAPIIKAQHPLSYRDFWPLLARLDALRKLHGPVPQGDRRALPSLEFDPGHPGHFGEKEAADLKRAVPVAVVGLKRNRKAT